MIDVIIQKGAQEMLYRTCDSMPTPSNLAYSCTITLHSTSHSPEDRARKSKNFPRPNQQLLERPSFPPPLRDVIKRGKDPKERERVWTEKRPNFHADKPRLLFRCALCCTDNRSEKARRRTVRRPLFASCSGDGGETISNQSVFPSKCLLQNAPALVMYRADGTDCRLEQEGWRRVKRWRWA